jgi:hypothetical protein
MSPDELRRLLCSAFCAGVRVTPVASGYAVGSAFSDHSGDQIGFYVALGDGEAVIEDDGSYLSHLVASDVAIDQGTRGHLLDAILDSVGAFWDRETFEIKTPPFPVGDLGARCVAFLSGLLRVRDLELLTRDVVRSTFRDDVTLAVSAAMGHAADFETNAPIASGFDEFPADLVIRPKSSVPTAQAAALFFANSVDRLNEALLLKMEALRLAREDFEVVAVLEKADPKILNSLRFQRAQNRGVVMPIFRRDERESVDLIRRTLRLPRAA